MGDGSDWQRDGEDTGVVPVRPVVRGRGLPTLPRTVVVAIVVGLLTFVAGIQLGGGRAAPTVTPSPSSVAAESPSPDLSPTPVPPIARNPGTSDISRSFRPHDAIVSVDGGSACVTHDQSTDTLDTGTPVHLHTWSTYCPIKRAARAPFIQGVLDAIGATALVSSWSAGINDAGSTVALFPYEEPPFSGTVMLTADAAGSGYEIVITLEERVVQ